MNALEHLLINHEKTIDLVIVTIGLPILLTVITLFIQNRIAKKDQADKAYQFKQQLMSQKFQREQTKELKVSEFRQAWINNLRDAIAYYGQITSDGKNREIHSESVVGHYFKIQMMMNPNDKDYHELLSALKYRADKMQYKGSESLDPANDNLVEVGQRILKREWDRLKTDLGNIEENSIDRFIQQ